MQNDTNVLYIVVVLYKLACVSFDMFNSPYKIAIKMKDTVEIQLMRIFSTVN